MKKKGYNKSQGLAFYRKKQYHKAVSSLEKALQEDKNDPEIYFYLGLASLFTEDIDGARRYFKRGLGVEENHIGLLKGLAFLYLKDERIEDAIGVWSEVLEQKPGDRTVTRALQKLREAEDTQEFIQTAKPSDFLSPGPPFWARLKPYVTSFGISLGVIILGVVFYTTPLYDMALKKLYPEYSRLRNFSLPENTTLVKESAEDVLYYFNKEEIQSQFHLIKKHIYKERYNRAIILLNRVMHSNASPLTKEKFNILYEFIETPDPLSLEHNPGYSEIIKEPKAFEGVYVRWTGKIANLQKGKEHAQFDLLVNYQNEDTIQGIARININGVYYIQNGQNVEVFGSFTGYDKQTGKLHVTGILLRDLKA